MGFPGDQPLWGGQGKYVEWKTHIHFHLYHLNREKHSEMRPVFITKWAKKEAKERSESSRPIDSRVNREENP